MSCVSNFIETNYQYLLDMSNRYVGENYGGDLLNDLTLTYLENIEKYESICKRGELMSYTSRSMAICGFSSNSRFYYKYKKHTEKLARRYPVHILASTEDDYSITNQKDVDEQITEAFIVLKEIRWFDAEVFKSYYLHSHSLKSLSDATGINKNTLYQSIQKAKNYLKKNQKRIG